MPYYSRTVDMSDHIYDVDLYLSKAQNKHHGCFLEALCLDYDVNHSRDHFGYGGINVEYDKFEESIWEVRRLGASIKQSRLIEFLTALPKETIIDRITYTPNLKSNARLQTDDLEAKYYVAEEHVPRFQQICASDHVTYRPRIHMDMVDMTTQTDPCDLGDCGSESGTEYDQSKYDTEYSLEMWEYYRHESVVYQNPLLNASELAKCELKHQQTSLETQVVAICRGFEHNLEQLMIKH